MDISIVLKTSFNESSGTNKMTVGTSITTRLSPIHLLKKKPAYSMLILNTQRQDSE